MKLYNKFIKCRCCNKQNNINYTKVNQKVIKECINCKALNSYITVVKDLIEKYSIK